MVLFLGKSMALPPLSLKNRRSVRRTTAKSSFSSVKSKLTPDHLCHGRTTQRMLRRARGIRFVDVARISSQTKWFNVLNWPVSLQSTTSKDDGNLYSATLQILNVTVEDAGKYKVTAKNELGESNATISLNFDSKYPFLLVLVESPLLFVPIPTVKLFQVLSWT